MGLAKYLLDYRIKMPSRFWLANLASEMVVQRCKCQPLYVNLQHVMHMVRWVADMRAPPWLGVTTCGATSCNAHMSTGYRTSRIHVYGWISKLWTRQLVTSLSVPRESIHIASTLSKAYRLYHTSRGFVPKQTAASMHLLKRSQSEPLQVKNINLQRPRWYCESNSLESLEYKTKGDQKASQESDTTGK
jgi:hypothetical protein